MSLHAYQTYQNQSVATASPGTLTLMLYNGCLKFIKQAKTTMAAREYEAKNIHLLRAEKIIQELMVSLDPNVAISHGMMQMYDYIQHRLVEANVQNNDKILTEVEGYIIEFRDAWQEILLADRKQRYGTGREA